MGYKYYQVRSSQRDVENFLEAAQPYFDLRGYSARIVDRSENTLIRFDFGDGYASESGSAPSAEKFVEMIYRQTFKDLAFEFPRFDLDTHRNLIEHSLQQPLRPLDDGWGGKVEGLVSGAEIQIDVEGGSVKSEETEQGWRIFYTLDEEHAVKVNGELHFYQPQYIWEAKGDGPLVSSSATTLSEEIAQNLNTQPAEIREKPEGYLGLAKLLNSELNDIQQWGKQIEAITNRYQDSVEPFFADDDWSFLREPVGRSLTEYLGFNELEEVAALLSQWGIPHAEVKYTGGAKELTPDQYRQLGSNEQPDLVALAQTAEGPVELLLTDRKNNYGPYIGFRDQVYADQDGVIWCCKEGSEPVRVEEFLELDNSHRETTIRCTVDPLQQNVSIGGLAVEIPQELRQQAFDPGEQPVTSHTDAQGKFTSTSVTATVAIPEKGTPRVIDLQRSTRQGGSLK